MTALFARPGPRFVAEAVAIVLAAVIPGLEHLVWWQIGACVAVVLLTAIAVESAMSGASAPAPAAAPTPPVVAETPHVRVLHEKPLGELIREPVRAPEPVALPEPEPEPVPEPVAVAVAPPERVGGPPFNVWELERAYAATGSGDDEKTFLLQYLRDYAAADGTLPSEFDDLVRESFSHLL